MLPGSPVPRAKITVTSLHGASLVTSLAVLDPELPPPLPPPPPIGNPGNPGNPPDWASGEADATVARTRGRMLDVFILKMMCKNCKKSKKFEIYVSKLSIPR